MIRFLRQKVVVYEVKTKHAKEGRLIPKGVLQQCCSSARQAIPEILGKFLPNLTSQPLLMLLPFSFTDCLKKMGNKEEQWRRASCGLPGEQLWTPRGCFSEYANPGGGGRLEEQ